MIFLGALNSTSLRFSAYLNNISTLCKSATLVVIIVMGLINLGLGETEHFKNSFVPIDKNSGFSISRLASGKI